MNKKDVTRQCVRSSGAGGQNVNKTASCVILTHTPTGMQVKCQDTRDQYKNEEIAWQRLEDRLSNIHSIAQRKKIDSDRYNQIGNGERSDKRRTYRVEEDLVIDHESNKRCRFRDVLRGRIELLQ